MAKTSVDMHVSKEHSAVESPPVLSVSNGDTSMEDVRRADAIKPNPECKRRQLCSVIWRRNKLRAFNDLIVVKCWLTNVSKL